MPSVSYDELTPAEREELSLCGITCAEQLAKTAPADLMQDVENLKAFFPSRAIVLTEERAYAICGAEDEEHQEEFNLKTNSTQGIPTTTFKRRKNLREALLKEQELKEQERHASPKSGSSVGRLERAHGLSKHFHAIRCSHPYRVYFGAIATLLLIIPFVALLSIPVMILTGDLDSGKPLYYGLGFLALVLPWLMVARRAECGVCHIPLYRFGNYSHSKDAHHLPFLGYTFTTALHIIFLFWFRCPACGTQMKISGYSHRHRHH